MLENQPQDPDALIQQLEFYFSDANLSKSKYMKEQMKQDRTNEGYIKISVIQTFNRVKNYSVEQIQEAVRKSTKIALSPDGTCIKRTEPLPVIFNADVERRTIYVDHLPNDITHDKLKEVFSRFGEVVYVSVPTMTGADEITKPKGFAFIEFLNEDSASSALNFDGEKIGDREVLVISKKSWFLISSKYKEKKEKSTRKNRKEIRFKTNDINKIIHFIIGSKPVTRKYLIDNFKNICPFIYLDYAPGQTEGYLRVKSKKDAETFVAVMDDKIEVGEAKIRLSILEGDEEAEYFKKIEAARANKNKNPKRDPLNKKGKVTATDKPKHIIFSDSEDETKIKTEKLGESDKITDETKIKTGKPTIKKTKNDPPKPTHIVFSDSESGSENPDPQQHSDPSSIKTEEGGGDTTNLNTENRKRKRVPSDNSPLKIPKTDE